MSMKTSRTQKNAGELPQSDEDREAWTASTTPQIHRATMPTMPTAAKKQHGHSQKVLKKDLLASAASMSASSSHPSLSYLVSAIKCPNASTTFRAPHDKAKPSRSVVTT
mmetsp:Transcript_26042/g.44699  ORF Transcript_26042/g.44699 Transcript_26042/m.44699 type:complete len:109 (-) Transcript_26042:372-698(-)